MPKRICRSLWIVALAALCLGAPAAQAQGDCPSPPIPQPPKNNIFSEEQENHLGDVIAEYTMRQYRVIADEEVSAELARIGERLLQHLPPSSLRFEFYLVDLPVTNAFVIPGGRVFVTRKLVALTRTEDELAGVMAHEIGHAVARDGAVNLSRLFRQVLRVNEVGDRKDIYDKFHQYLENLMRRRPGPDPRNRHEGDQMDADRLGVYLMARAGYAPAAYADFWDRFTENQGRMGNWFTDLFGTTRPESRRLREISRTLGKLPPECTNVQPVATQAEYQKWQAAVVAYTGLGHREAVPGLIARKQLDPPLRGEVTHLRFSPDGNYILAQDDSGITVLTRQPFEPAFRIPAPEAYRAQFTPDSQEILFHNSALRVERWSIAEEQRVAAHEIALLRGCIQSVLSPDGKLLGCFGGEFELRLVDVESGETVFQRKEFYLFTFWDFLRLLRNLGNDDFQVLYMGFSPDMRYFVVARGARSLALNLNANYANVPLRGPLQRLVGGGFVFLDADRLMGVNYEKPEKSAVVKFPSGEVITELALGQQSLAPPGKGNYVLLRPIQKHPVGVMNLETKKIFMANKTTALDIYNNVFVAERVSGELALYSNDSEEPIARTLLPRTQLGTLRAATVSPDMNWLAVSQRNRGAVWNLERGERIYHVRGFRGAHIDGDVLYADFPKFQETARQIARLRLTQPAVEAGPEISEDETSQYGPLVVTFKPAEKESSTRRNVTMEVRDARNLKVLWTRHYPGERPNVYVEPTEGTMVLQWFARDAHARQEIRDDPSLGVRTTSLREGDYFLEVVTGRDGSRLGRIFLDSGRGSISIRGAMVRGDWLVMTDSQNRVLVYSLSSGEPKGRVFGNKAALSDQAGLLCVENVQGQLALYDLDSLEKRREFTFPSTVSLARFSEDGRRLFVLTDNQTVYWIDVSSS